TTSTTVTTTSTSTTTTTSTTVTTTSTSTTTTTSTTVTTTSTSTTTTTSTTVTTTSTSTTTSTTTTSTTTTTVANGAPDCSGAASGAVTVCVPHDQRPGQACDDGGALFDSTGPGATSDRDGIVPLVAGGKGDAAPPGCVIGLALGSPATCSAGRPATLARRLTTVQALLARAETA